MKKVIFVSVDNRENVFGVFTYSKGKGYEHKNLMLRMNVEEWKIKVLEKNKNIDISDFQVVNFNKMKESIKDYLLTNSVNFMSVNSSFLEEDWITLFGTTYIDGKIEQWKSSINGNNIEVRGIIELLQNTNKQLFVFDRCSRFDIEDGGTEQEAQEYSNKIS